MSISNIEPPRVYVIAGPNGAGKTTFSAEFLPDFVDCREFLNADLIAAGLAPFAPETQNLRAGRLLLTRIKELTKSRQDFGFETTLAGRGYIPKLEEMKNHGYRIMLFFLWLPSTELAVARVKNRVRQGGHDVPEPVIRRRFESGIRNLFQHYRSRVDSWWLYDASRLPPSVVARKRGVTSNCLIPICLNKSNELRRDDSMNQIKVQDVSLLQKADAAFRQAARKIILRARQTNTPIVVWEEGRVKEIPYEHFEIATASMELREM